MKKSKRTKYLGILGIKSKATKATRLVAVGPAPKDHIMGLMAETKRQQRPSDHVVREWVLPEHMPFYFSAKYHNPMRLQNAREAFIHARETNERAARTSRHGTWNAVGDVEGFEFMTEEDYEVEKVLDTLNDSNDTWPEAEKQEW